MDTSNNRAEMTDPAQVLEFVLAGNSRFTLVSKKTGERFTFRVRQPDKTTPHFVKVLTGPDNGADYRFIGTIFKGETYKLGKRSAFGWEAPSQMAFAWFWAQLRLGRISPFLEFWHEGRCCVCGRALTVPESLKNGIGPDCAGRRTREEVRHVG